MKTKFIFCLVILSLWALGGYVLEKKVIEQQKTYNTFVNTVAHQTMLSQKAIFLSHQLLLNPNDQTLIDLQHKLSQTASRLAEDQKSLALRDLKDILGKRDATLVNKFYQGDERLHHNITVFVDQLYKVIDLSEKSALSATSKPMEYLREHQDNILQDLNAAQTFFQHQEIQIVEKLEFYEIFLLVGFILTVCIMGAYVFWPMNHEIDTLMSTQRDLKFQLTSFRKKSENLKHDQGLFFQEVLSTMTPIIHSIQGLLGSLKEQGPDVQKIHHALQYLTKTMTDMGEMAKIDAGVSQLSLRDITLKTTLQETLGIIAPIAQSKNISVKCLFSQSHPQIYSDHIKFKQALLNVLMFYLDYAPAGEISIHIKDDENTLGRFDLEFVHPTFILHQSRRELLFDSFSIQEHGLNLALTKKYVEMCQGTIHAGTADHEGCSIKMNLPYRVRLEGFRVA